MFQDHALFPHRDVAGNIAFGLTGPRAATRARVEELLTLVGLSGAGPRAVATLSGGEAQRVALARALAPAPRLLMLDEPLGQLDRSLRERLTIELRQLFVRLGTTVLAVTHDQQEAFALADRVIVMDAGRIVQIGTPQEVWERPASPFVAGFLGFRNVRQDTAGPYLIRPAGVRLDPSGSLSGTVAAATFRGEHVDLLLDIDGEPPLEGRCAPSGVPPVGSAVRISVDPAEVVRLEA
jgi:thiamine transport system ATP-binding protein